MIYFIMLPGVILTYSIRLSAGRIINIIKMICSSKLMPITISVFCMFSKMFFHPCNASYYRLTTYKLNKSNIFGECTFPRYILCMYETSYVSKNQTEEGKIFRPKETCKHEFWMSEIIWQIIFFVCLTEKRGDKAWQSHIWHS